MPELPEVETIRRQLNELVIGKRIKELEITDPKLKKLFSDEILGKIKGLKILAVERQAKVLILKLDKEQLLAFHLKMTGRVIYQSSDFRKTKTDKLPNKYTRAIFNLGNENYLYFQDLRRFGWIKYFKNKTIDESFLKERIGIEPISKSFTANHFQTILKKSQKPIKVFLLDQAKIGGIGNIYANEALYLAKINPATRSGELTEAQIINLKAAIIEVLNKGIKYGGASDSDYLDAYGLKGSYQDHFLIYQKHGQKCIKCGTVIQRVKIGGRGTFFCPNCQKL